jgi:hypothetical protein
MTLNLGRNGEKDKSPRKIYDSHKAGSHDIRVVFERVRIPKQTNQPRKQNKKTRERIPPDDKHKRHSTRTYKTKFSASQKMLETQGTFVSPVVIVLLPGIEISPSFFVAPILAHTM